MRCYRLVERWCFFICKKFMLPKRRFWRDEQKINADFRGPFEGCDYSNWAKNHWKSIENPHFIFCSSFQNLRLGSIKFASGLHLHTHEMTKLRCDELLSVGWAMMIFICKKFASGLPLHTHEMTTLRCDATHARYDAPFNTHPFNTPPFNAPPFNAPPPLTRTL